MRPTQPSFIVTLLVAVVLAHTPALAAPGIAAGRKHAAKANRLAAQNRCKAAVVEFSKAYKLLGDPALLFDRGECYRKIGKDSQALKDYQQFIVEMPNAPNRPTIEARITLLRGGTPSPTTGLAKTPANPAEREPPAGDSHAEGRGKVNVAPVGDAEKTTESSQGAGSAAIGTAAPALNETHPEANLTTQQEIPEPKRGGRSHAWIWIGTAVVVVGAGAFAAYHYWPRPKTDVPQTPLGNYAF
jgi:tetratricopeptide (TPR) repeat protein